MNRLVVSWRESDGVNKTPRKRVLVSPVYDDEESKRRARQWLRERLDKEPCAGQPGTYTRYKVVEEELTAPPPKA